MTAPVATRVQRVIGAVFGIPVESVSAATSQDTIEGWDSLTHIHLIAALEAEFGVSIDVDRAIEMTSFAAICRALQDA